MTSLSSDRPSGPVAAPQQVQCLCGHDAGSHNALKFNCMATTGGTHATRCGCKAFTDADRPSGQTPPTAPSPATPAPSLRDLAERVLTTGGSLRALRAAPIVGTTKEYHTADMQARQAFNQAFDAFSEAATPAAIIALSDELESTRSALQEAQEDTKRYRYLRDNGLAEALRCRDGLIELHFGHGSDSVTMKTGMVGGLANVLIDAAVDAALDAAAGSTT